MDDILWELMQSLQELYGYTHTASVRRYLRDGRVWVNVNPVRKDGYSFAKFISKLTIANDNHTTYGTRL